MGTLLAIGIGQPTTNTAQVTDEGEGDVQAEWNGGPVHSFTGVATTVVQAERTRTNQITFNLTGARTSPTAVAVGSIRPNDAVTSRRGGHPLTVHSPRTSGIAVQTSSVLTVTVNEPKVNIVQINNEGAGDVQVEWNGGPTHAFTGVETIVVDTKNARKDQVTLNESPQ